MVVLALAGLAVLLAIMAGFAAYLMSQRQGAKTEEAQEEEEATVVGVSIIDSAPAKDGPPHLLYTGMS
jgi:hypothetical protein